MGIKFRVALLLLLLAVAANAQEKPDAPKPKTDKVFWVGTTALAAAKTFDAIETASLLSRGGHENNPVFGQHPSPARLGLLNAAIFAGEVVMFRFTEHSRFGVVRWLGRGYISFTVAQHVRNGACDAGVNTQSPITQNCGVF